MTLELRPLRSDEVSVAADLVRRVFMQCVAPLYNAEGIVEFLSYASSESLARRMRAQLEILVAVDREDRIVGVVGLRDRSHISLLFVETQEQRTGIGRRLVQAVVDACRREGRRPTQVTVNASPNSVSAYESYGFEASGPEQEKSGIRFVPMSLTVA